MRSHSARSAGPRTIDQFIGQVQVCGQVRVALNATWTSNNAFPHALLLGPPGLGKTQLARTIAAEMGVVLKETLGQTLSKPNDVAGFLLSACERDVLLIDEAHELPARSQVALYRALEDGTLFLDGAAFGKNPSQIDLPPFTLLMATTDEHRLSKPLRERAQLRLNFEFYSPADLVRVLQQRAALAKLEAEEVVFAKIADRAKGTPRRAIQLLGACELEATAAGDSCISAQHCLNAFARQGVDDLGLEGLERTYLELLGQAGRPVRPHCAAGTLGIEFRTLSEVVEPYLLRARLIERLDKGRVLTSKGSAHLAAQASLVHAVPNEVEESR